MYHPDTAQTQYRKYAGVSIRGVLYEYDKEVFRDCEWYEYWQGGDWYGREDMWIAPGKPSVATAIVTHGAGNLVVKAIGVAEARERGRVATKTVDDGVIEAGERLELEAYFLTEIYGACFPALFADGKRRPSRVRSHNTHPFDFCAPFHVLAEQSLFTVNGSLRILSLEKLCYQPGDAQPSVHLVHTRRGIHERQHRQTYSR